MLAVLAGSISVAQKTKWKEMEQFHTVISQTFHPAEHNKLQPTRDQAPLLLNLAKQWQQAAIPENFNAVKTKRTLAKLVKACNLLSASVASNKTDAVLKKQIYTVHELFHEIAEKCSH